MAAKKNSKQLDKNAARGSKTAFILAQAPATPAKVVVQRAAEQGLKITAAYVYNIRNQHKVRRRANEAAPESAREVELRKLFVDVGIARSKEILADVEVKVKQVVHGG